MYTFLFLLKNVYVYLKGKELEKLLEIVKKMSLKPHLLYVSKIKSW